MIQRREWLLLGAQSLLLSPLLAGAADVRAQVLRSASAGLEPVQLTAHERALHALNRLGFGPSPADAAAIEQLGPQRWLQQFLLEQTNPERLSLPSALQARLDGFDTLKLSQGELLGRYREAARVDRVDRLAKSAAGADSSAATNPISASVEASAPNNRRDWVRPVLLQAGSQRLLRALQSPAQLEERLVDFWFNHFNVFSGKGPLSVLVGNYEREAIRPHVWGSFRAMLGATARHPAMLIYLDNAQSVAAGLRPVGNANGAAPPRLSGLNENYARELMELHTLGVGGGYNQLDVTELARMLTGWTLDERAVQRQSRQPLFSFMPRRHDTGSKQWLGRSVAAAGQAEGEMALDVLAAHPATAQHLAFKLAQAFVADQPPAGLVQRLAASFLASRGDLRVLMQTLIESEEFWSSESVGAKFKTPYQYLLSSLRALQIDPLELQPLLGTLAQAGMPLYGAPTPDGYKNVAAAWMNPEALAQRVQWAINLNQRRQRQAADAAQDSRLLLTTLGPLFSAATRQVVAQEAPAMQSALLLASPDFMRC